ncbi:MAG: large conductance mechanosensitive channel protein MscL [Nitrososphaerales archaeon]
MSSVTKNTDNEMLEELKKIRELLTPPPAAQPPKGMRSEFLAFLAEYKVLGLAVAFIIGIYLGGVVQALVKDIILPPISFALGGGGGSAFETAVLGPFLIGDFALAVITFIIVALVIFLIVKVAASWGLNK